MYTHKPSHRVMFLQTTDNRGRHSGADFGQGASRGVEPGRHPDRAQAHTGTVGDGEVVGLVQGCDGARLRERAAIEPFAVQKHRAWSTVRLLRISNATSALGHLGLPPVSCRMSWSDTARDVRAWVKEAGKVPPKSQRNCR